MTRNTRTTFIAAGGLALFAACTLVDAKRMYKYVDADGIQHFSDRPPQGEVLDLQQELVDVEPRSRVFLSEEGPDFNRRMVFFNGYYGPVGIHVALLRAQNIVTQPRSLPEFFVLEGRQREPLLTITPLSREHSWSYKLHYSAVPGDPRAQPNRDFSYAIPFGGDDKQFVSQGFNGERSHQYPQSYFAIDISLPEGTPVLAARDGVVMDVEQDFYRSGWTLELAGEANIVRILHDDGSMAIYAHLALEGVRVKPGQTVLAREYIADSGNTGFSSGPHLHFAIQANDNGQLVSIPFELYDPVSRKSFTPRRGNYLRPSQAL